MEMLKALMPLLTSLLEGVKNLFLGLFLINTGKEKQKLEDLAKEQEAIEQHKQMADNLRSKSRKSRLSVLLPTKTDDDKKS